MRKYMLMVAVMAGFAGAVWGNIAPLPTTKPATTSKPSTATAPATTRAAVPNAPAKG